MKFSDSKAVQIEQILGNLKDHPIDIELVIDAPRAFVLAGMLQKALRQPDLQSNVVAEETRKFTQSLIDLLGEIDPQAQAFLEQNWKA